MSYLRLARNIIPQIIFMGQVDFATEIYESVLAPALNIETHPKHYDYHEGYARERKARRDHGIFFFRRVLLNSLNVSGSARSLCPIIIMVFHRALVQIEYPLERLMPLVHLFQEKYNDEVVPRILEVCIEMDKVRVVTKSFP